MGAVFSRVFGGKKEDSKTDVREPKHRKRWSFRTARRNDEHTVNVPTRSSTLPARAQRQVQDERTGAQTHESAEFENVPRVQATEFEELDENAVANRVQEILKDVADDEEKTPTQIAKPIEQKQEPEPIQRQPPVAEVANSFDTNQVTDNVVKPSEASALVSAALGPVDLGEAEAKVSQVPSEMKKAEDHKLDEIEPVMQEQTQAVNAEEPGLLDVTGRTNFDPSSMQESVKVSEEHLESDIMKGEEGQHKLDELEPVMQEQTQAVNAEEPSLLDVISQSIVDQATTEEPIKISEEHLESDLVKVEEEEHKMNDIEPAMQEQTQTVNTEEPSLLDVISHSIVDHAATEESVKVFEEDFELDQRKGEEEEHKLEESENEPSNLDETENVSAGYDNSDNLAQPQEPTDLTADNLEDNEAAKQAVDEHVELIQDTHLQAAPLDETLTEKSEQLDSELQPHSEVENVTNESPENMNQQETENDLKQTDAEADSAIDNEPKEEELITENNQSSVGDFVTTILDDAKHKVEMSLTNESNPTEEIQPETEDVETNQSPTVPVDSDDKQQLDQIENDETNLESLDDQFVEQFVSSASDNNQEQNTLQNEQMLDNLTNEKAEKILEKALNLDGETPLVPNDHTNESVTNGYQE